MTENDIIPNQIESIVEKKQNVVPMLYLRHKKRLHISVKPYQI